MSVKKPQYSSADIEAVKTIHKIAPDGVCRVRLEWSESREKWDKHPVAHWPPRSLPKPAHAHWPELKSDILNLWFNNSTELKGIGISCHKFGMVGIDLDEGDMETLVTLVEKLCGATPLGRAKTQRGSRIYYQVKDEDRYNPIVGWNIEGFDGKGEILLFTQYDYIWDPIATKNAIMANINGDYRGPSLDLSIFKTTKKEKVKIEQNRNISKNDSIDARTIAETYNLEIHPDKANTWRGACPFCREGETRFEVTQGDIRPLVRCWVCNAEGTPDTMAEIYRFVRKNHPSFMDLNRSIDNLISSRPEKTAPTFHAPVVDQPKPSIFSNNFNRDIQDNLIKFRSCLLDGKEIVSAFLDDAEVAIQGEYAGKPIWILKTPPGQKTIRALIAIQLIGASIRKVRYGQYPQYSLDEGKNWDLLTDGEEADLWIEVERKVFLQNTDSKGEDKISALSPTAEVKRMVLDSMQKIQVDPVKDWLEDLPDWDGVNRLDTNMEEQGMTIDAECELSNGKRVDLTHNAQAYLPLEIVRMTYYPGAQRNPMPVLRGKGGEGKSSYGQRILPPHLQEEELYTADYKLTMPSQKAGQLLSKVKVVELREFGINRYSDLDEAKSNAMASTADYRVPWGRRPITLQRHDACYVTTNQGNLPGGDPALHRRFWYCTVTGKANLNNKKAWTKFDEIVEGSNYTYREMLFAEAKERVLNSKEPESYSVSPDLEPEEYMEYNMKMGGTYDTPGEDFQEYVDEAVDQLIQRGDREVTMRDMKAAIICIEYSQKITSAEEIERISESSSMGPITRAGAKEMIAAMRGHRNDKVKRAVKRNAEHRNGQCQGLWRYEWKRGKYHGKEVKRDPPQFEMIGDVSPDGEDANPFE